MTRLGVDLRPCGCIYYLVVLGDDEVVWRRADSCEEHWSDLDEPPLRPVADVQLYDWQEKGWL